MARIDLDENSNIVSEHREPQQFWVNRPALMSRRGHFWITGERIKKDNQNFQHGPMFVQWEAPEQVTQPYPVILVHGGRLQGTEWMDTPDGRPGWAQRLMEAGYAVLIVDRPGHGRSRTHPDIADTPGPAFSYEEGERVYFPPGDRRVQTQWPFGPDDTAMLDSFIAAFSPLPTSFRESQEMDVLRLSALFDKIGPAILMTHSASGPLGWMVADRRPKQVVAIVSIEPMGPAFAKVPGIGSLDWGLTAGRVTYFPERQSPEDVRSADPLQLQIPSIKSLPIAVVTGEASIFAKNGPAIVNFLNTAGASATQIHLPDFGVLGNGHGLIYEKNSDEALKPVMDWLTKVTGAAIPENKVSNIKENTVEIPGKVTLHVIYKGDKNTRFDHDYYKNIHCPMVMEAWKPYGLESGARFIPIDQGSDTILIWSGIFKDRSSLEAAFSSPLTSEIMEDVKKFTDLTPSRQISEAL